MEGNQKIEPKVYLTVGKSNNGQRFGDPHAIYHAAIENNAIQVGGFVAIKDHQNSLLELAKNWQIPPGF